MPETRTTLGSGGRLVIPAAYRKALGVKSGDTLIVSLDGEELRVFSPQEAVRRAQALVRRYVPAKRRLADELIRERRRDARRE